MRLFRSEFSSGGYHKLCSLSSVWPIAYFQCFPKKADCNCCPWRNFDLIAVRFRSCFIVSAIVSRSAAKENFYLDYSDAIFVQTQTPRFCAATASECFLVPFNCLLTQHLVPAEWPLHNRKHCSVGHSIRPLIIGA